MSRMENIVMFSGGKDSTAMLFLMIEHDIPIDEVIYCDLGVEFPEMEEHINKVECVSGLPITRLKPSKSFTYMLGFHHRMKGKNLNTYFYDDMGNKVAYKGQEVPNKELYMNSSIGYGWADMGVRWCTTMKSQTISRYMREVRKRDIVEFHGIALDEGSRLNKNKDRVIRYPLVEFGYTEKMALEYCYNLGFDWGGLYKIKGRVSCFCCPLQNMDDLRYLYNQRPELWQKLKEMDELSYRSFKPNKTLKQIEEILQGEKQQLMLFN